MTRWFQGILPITETPLTEASAVKVLILQNVNLTEIYGENKQNLIEVRDQVPQKMTFPSWHIFLCPKH